MNKTDIAIIGMACRFPDADNYNQFWENLKNGVNSIKEIPPERWDIDKYYSPIIDEPNTSISKWCGLVENIDQFDNRFFYISPREAKNMDPQQRLLLEEARHCIEDAGVALNTLQKRITAVYVGVMASDYHQEASAPGVVTDSYAALGNYDCILANRLSYTFGLRGPSTSIDAACAASLVALHQAKSTLVSGESDYAIVAGVSLNFHPWKYISFSKSRMLSPDGQCKTFDKAANGYVPGEGVGVLLLQRLEDARHASNHIYGILKGSALNHGGQTRSITAPRVEAQQSVILAAYTDAGISPETVTYTEAHGTGTSLGDPIEIEALNRAFHTYTKDRHFCRIGSVKTNIGHLEAAAGIAGVIKVLLMLRHHQIPPSLHVKTLNPIINFVDSPFTVVTELCDWHSRKPGLPLRAGVSSFGFGGVNSHAVLESFPQDNTSPVSGDNQGTAGSIFLLSAKSPNALKKTVEEWQSFVENNAFATYRLQDMCGTLMTGRGSFAYRYGHYVKSKAELQTVLHNDRLNLSKQTTHPWCLRVGEFDWESIVCAQSPLFQEPLFQNRLNQVQHTLSTLNVPQEFREDFLQSTWPEPAKPLYEFMLSYVYLSVLIEAGFAPVLITGEKSGILVSLTLSGIIALKDALAILSHCKTLPQVEPVRPTTTPFYDPLTRQTLMPYHFDEVYLLMLVEEIRIPSEVLCEYVEKARLLNKTQFTFKKYLEEWNPVLKQSSGKDIDQMLYDDGLITSHDEMERRQQVLLMVMISGSLLQLNQKWQLRARRPVPDERFYELLDLVVDGVMPKDAVIEMFKQETPVFETIAVTLNKRQEYINPDNPYEILKEHSRNVKILPDMPTWFEQAITIDATLPVLKNVSCLNFGKLSELTFSDNAFHLTVTETSDNILQETLLQLWLHGVDITWDILFPEGSFQKVALPTHGFDRLSFWLTKQDQKGFAMRKQLSEQRLDELLEQVINGSMTKDTLIKILSSDNPELAAKVAADMLQQTKSSAPLNKNMAVTLQQHNTQGLSGSPERLTRETGKQAESDIVYYYIPTWVEQPLSHSERNVSGRTAIVFPGDDCLAKQLFHGITRRYQQSFFISKGNTFLRKKDGNFEIDAAKEQEYVQVIQHIFAEENNTIEDCDIYFLWAYTPDALSIVDEQDLEDIQVNGLRSFFFLVKALCRFSSKRAITIIAATRECHVVTERDRGEGYGTGGLFGFAQTVMLEYPGITIKMVDLAGKEPSPTVLIDEGLSSEFAARVAYREQSRYVHIVEPLSLPGNQGIPALQDQGVYLLIGGAGGIGLKIAEFITQLVRARLVLVGRSELSAEKQQRIKLLERSGSEIIYLQADIADMPQMKAVIKHIKQRYGALNGVIQASGILEDKLLVAKNWDSFRRVLSSKVLGTWIVNRLTQAEPLDFFVTFSSVVSLLGNVGQADYAAANSFLDIFIHYRDRNNYPGKSLNINWTLWAEGGMGTEPAVIEAFSKKAGVINSQEGLHAFAQLLNGRLCQAVVTGHSQVFTSRGANQQPQPEEIIMNSVTSMEKEAKQPQRTNHIQDDLLHLFAAIIEVSPSELDKKTDLREFGLDSIMLTEFAERISTRLGVAFNSAMLYEYTTIEAIAEYVNEHAPEESTRHFYQEPVTEQAVQAAPTDLPEVEKALLETPVHQEAEEQQSIKQSEKHSLVTETAALPAVTLPIRSSQDVAIIGMSGRFPGAHNLSEFWDNLINARDMISEIPEDRWDWQTYWGNPQGNENKTNSKWGGFVEDVKAFDAAFFHISPKEAEVMDPQQRLLLEEIWHTLEDAGYKPSALSGSKIGVFIGVCNNDYADLLSANNVRQDAYISTGLDLSILPNRISYFLDVHGPSVAIDTACSSSIVAMHQAIQAIKNADCTMALAGGVNLCLTPKRYCSLSHAGALSPDGRCKTFDKGANGYVRGEGVGVVLLKPLSKAVADGDHIYGVVKGSAVNHGGLANSLTAPNPHAQAELLITAYERANIDPETVTYIEAHGTGTRLGDPIEMNGLKKAFEELYTRWNKPTATQTHGCGIGSVKTHIGHLEGAAGVAGVIKVLLAMQYRKLPANLHFRELNPYIQLEGSPFFIVKESQTWGRLRDEKQQSLPRRAGVSSFGYGGANAHIVVEEYDTLQMENEELRMEGPQLIVLSAKNQERLRAYAQEMTDFLEQRAECPATPSLSLADFAYTLQMGREALEERLAIVVSSLDEVKEKFKQFAQEQTVVAGLYQGGTKAHKTITEFLVGGEAGEAFLNIVIKNKELDRLAQLWVSGVEIDWKLFYRMHRPNRLSLPTYPFARKRYWIPESENIVPTLQASRFKLQPQKLHPLVHHNTSTLQEQQFSTRFTGKEFYLADHHVAGQKILPGVAYLEMARAAGEIAGTGTIHRIKNIIWAQPITVDEQPQDVYISLYPEEHCVDYEVSIAGTDDQLVICSQGKLLYDYPDRTLPSSDGLDLEAVKTRCPQTMSHSECYRAFETSGLHYGPGFQPIEELWYNETEALCHLTLPAHLQHTFHDFGLHPTLLDGALQTIPGLLPHTNRSVPFLPFALGEVEIRQPLPETCYGYARLIKTGEVKTFHIQLLDSFGQVLARLSDFSVRAAARPATAAKVTPTGVQLLYVQSVWEDSSLEENKGEGTPSTAPMLIFDTDETLFQHCRKQLHSEKILLVKPGKMYQSTDNHVYTINPENQEEYRVLIQTLYNNNMIPDRIMYLWSKSNVSGKLEDSINTQLSYSIYSLFYLSQALLEQKPQKSLQLLYLYEHSKSDDNSDAFHAAISGFARTIYLENPKFIYTTLKVDNLSASGAVLDKMLREFQATDIPVEICYDGEQRQIKHFREFDPEIETVNDIPLRENGVYLITGGIGGLGLIFADYLARRWHANLILAGRSELSSEKEARLRQIRESGAEVMYVRADVSVRGDVQRLITEAKTRFNRIDGILHAAGVLRDAFILKKTRADMKAVFAPKIQSTLYLDEFTKDESLDIFVLFSSIAAVIGNIGQCDYAYANSFLDNFAQIREKMRRGGTRSGKTLSINWPLWQEGGMQIDAQMEELFVNIMGMHRLSTGLGLEVFEKALAGNKQQFVVLTGKARKIRQLLGQRTSKSQKESAGFDGQVDETELLRKLQKNVSEIVSAILKVEEQNIDLDEKMSEYGFDSISLTELVNQINTRYDLEIMPAVFFEYPSIKAFTTFLCQEYRDTFVRYYQDSLKTPQEPMRVETGKETHETPKLRARFQPLPIETIQHSGVLNEPIAVIGISGVMPQSESLHDFWMHLEQGNDLISEIPKDRWDWEAYYGDPFQEANKTTVKWGGFMNDVDRFDASFFRISPREAELMDPQHRIFLETVWKCIEDAGYKASALSGTKTGLFVGVSTTDYYDLLNMSGIAVEAYTSTGITHSMLPNRISYLLNLRGPSEPIDTACSSSLVTVHRAVTALQNGECDTAISGGVNVLLVPNFYISFNKAGMLSPDGKCKTFDKRANGYVRGEGAGAVFLKPLRKAQADNDHIYAVIKATAINHGGRATSLTAPNPNAQAELLIAAYEKADIDPSTISYIEAHGTGTALGDPIEINGLKKAFNALYEKRGRSLPKAGYCGLGSVKTNIGHLEAAAGIAGMLKVLLSMKCKTLPANVHFQELNPQIQLRDTPFYIVEKTQPWLPLEDGTGRIVPRRAGISSFGFGGANAHVVLEEYRHVSTNTAQIAPTGAQLVVLSAQNDEQLRVYTGKIADFLERNFLAEPVVQTSHQDIQFRIQRDLLKMVSEILTVCEQNIDLDGDIDEFGFDHIGLTDFAERINEKYQLRITLALFIEQRSVNALTRYLEEIHHDSVNRYYQSGLKEHAGEIAHTSPISLANIAYTLQIGREAQDVRLAMVVSNIGELTEKLTQYSQGTLDIEDVYTGRVKKESKSLGLLVSGESGEEFIKAVAKERDFHKLARLWVSGVSIDWRLFYLADTPNRISLPTYPFAKERYWIPEVKEQGTGSREQGVGGIHPLLHQKTSDISEQRFNSTFTGEESYELMTFKEVWHEEPLEEAPSGTSQTTLRTIVCFLSESDHQQAVVDAVRQFDQQTKLIFLTDSRVENTDVKPLYRLDRNDRTTYVEAFKSIRDTYGEADAVLYLWTLENTDDVRNFTSLVYLLQAMVSAQLKPRRVLFAAQFEHALDRCYLESWIGFERSLRLSLPNTQVAVICRDAGEQNEKGTVHDWMQRLWAELHIHKFQSVLYQKGKRHVCQIRSTTLESGNRLLKSGGTYLITGGCGGIGFLVARHLARTYFVNLILTGRSPMDEEKQSKINALEASGSQVVYIQADVCDSIRMKEGLSRAKALFGEINGVIHAAGVPAYGTVLENDIRDFQKVLEPKITGTLTLDDALHEDPLDFICYFSSSSSILGDFGSCDYAIANRFQMAYAQYRNQQQQQSHCHGKAIVINWPLWRNGGMGVGDADQARLYLKSSGQRFLETDEGLTLFERLLSQKNTQHLILVGQPSRLHHFLGLTQDHSFQSSPIISTSIGKGRRTEMKGWNVEQCLEWDLKEQVSVLLKISHDRLDRETNLADFGFDSISLAAFATTLTNHYGIDITPAVFFGHSTLAQLAHYFLTEHHQTIRAFYQEAIPEQDPVQKISIVATAPTRLQPGTSGFAKRSASQGVSEPIAIIGMSGRFPQARNIGEMWQILAEGRDVVQEIPDDRWSLEGFFHPDPQEAKTQGKSYSKWCGCVPGIREFEPLFFEISPREAENMDPRQRLLLQESWRALENAGYGATHIKKSTIGMFVGVEDGDYQQLIRKQGSITSNHSGILAARLAYFLDLKGPVIAMNTACSSGLVAVHQACLSLRNQECDTAVAAGISLMFTPMNYIVMSQAGMLSQDGRCYAFDKRANGMVPGEAVAVVVLKRLSQAEADGDPIYAIIRGSEINYDGKTNGITAPNGVAQTTLLKTVYDHYHVNPEEIEYIVTHGTGTKLGDPVEINALYAAFKDYTKKQGYCALTSTKTNFGHTLAASGLVSLISLVQAFRHELIPASLHCEQENEYINWKESPFYVNKTNKLWLQRDEKCRTGAVSAFGMSGTNIHMVVQSYATKAPVAPLKQAPYFLLALSAGTRESLQEKIKDMIAVLQNEDLQGQSLLQISYTLLEGRQHFRHRCAIVIQDREQAVSVLKHVGKKERLPNLFHGTVPRNFIEQKEFQRHAYDLLKQSLSLQGDKNRYGEILYALADLYCQGYDFTWSQLYGDDKPRRIHLPTYPFVRECYWVSETEKTLSHRQSTKLHPLLGSNTSTLQEQKFTTRFTGSEFFLSDHKVNGQKVLPGVAYLEMARAAGEIAGTGTIHMIKNIIWAQPITVDEQPQDVHISLYPEENRVDYEVRVAGADEQRVICSQGKLLYEPSDRALPASDRLDLEAVKTRCPQTISGSECYRSFAASGLHYGPGFQPIEELWYNDTEALCRLTLPAHLQRTFRDFGLHPTLLDGALQTIMGLMPSADQSGPFLPFALGEVEIRQPLLEICYGYAKLIKAGKVNTFNIQLLDSSGQVLVRLFDFSVRAVTRAATSAKIAPTPAQPLYFQAVWKPSEVEDVRQNVSGPVLIFDTDEALFQYCKKKLTPEHVLLVSPGEMYRNTERNMYTINPENREDYRLLSQTLYDNNMLPGRIMYLWAKADVTIHQGKGIESSLSYGVYPLLYLSQALMEQKPKECIRLLYLYEKVENDTVSFVPSAFHAAISGFARTIRLENPKFVYKTLAVDNLSATETILENTLREFRADDTSVEIRYNGPQRQIKGFCEAAIKTEAVHELLLKENGVYLITGGLGGLGLIFADYLARQWKANLILVGRSELSSEKETRLKKIRESAAEGMYLRADVSKRDDVQKLITETKSRFKKIDGILHAAGVLRDGFILNKTTTDLDAVLAPKVHGTLYLDEVTKDEQLDFFVLFSSISGVMGNLGQTDYAYANNFMDNFAQIRENLRKDRKRFGQTLSINWPLWQEGGMRLDEQGKIRLKKTTGMMPLQTGKGIDAFLNALACKTPQLIVVQGERTKLYKWLGIQPETTPNAGELRRTATPTPSHQEGQGVKELQAHTSAVSGATLQQKVEEDLVQLCSDLLKVKPGDMDRDVELIEYGVDSIMMMSMLNRIEELYGETVEPNAISEYPTISRFAEYLIKENIVKADVIIGETRVLEETGSSSGQSPDIRPSVPSFTRQRRRFTQSVVQKTPKVAVIGMACRFPGAKHLEAFWENVQQSKNCITEVPPHRWKSADYYSPDRNAPGKSYSKWGGYIEDIDLFDARYFGIPDEDALVIDPQQRILLELSQELLDRAGYTQTELATTRTGIFIGGAESSYVRENLESIPPEYMKHVIVNSIQNMMAARISDFYNLTGLSQTIDTACSSSLVAIHQACQEILMGECRMAIAGGVEILLDPFPHVGFSKAGALSDEDKSYVFDKRAKGIVLGEGVGLVLLKSYRQAIEDDDQILGVIVGSAVNNDGHTMGLTVPNLEGQKAVIQTAIEKSGVNPGTITCLEAHGTGTLLGDPIEIKAITQVYRKFTQDRQYCAVGSVKSNIGHLLHAAGVASFIKVLLALQHKKIPATLHCETPHPRFKFEDSPFYPVTETAEWIPRGGIRRAAISSFGFGGTNCHLILEEFSETQSNGYIRRREALAPTQFYRKRYWLGKEIVEPSKPNKIRFDATFFRKILIKLSQGQITPEQAMKLANTQRNIY